MAQRHMDRLTSFDTSFLTNEKSQRPHGDRGDAGLRGLAARATRTSSPTSAAACTCLPRLRQQLSYPPLGLGRPFWVDDSDFDVHKHVSRRSPCRRPAPTPSSTRLSPRPLAAARPLEAALGALPGRRLRERSLRDHLQDPPRDGRRDLSRRHRHAALRRRAQTRDRSARGALGAADGRPRGSAWSAAAVRGFVGTLRARRALALRRASADPRQRPQTRLRRRRRALGGELEPDQAGAQGRRQRRRSRPQRSFAWTTVRPRRVQDDQEHPRRHRQRRHARGRRRRPAALAARAATSTSDELELQALVPVSVRTENEHGELGNRLTAMRGPLPVQIADPVERLRYVTTEMDALKASKQPLGAEAIWGLNDWFRDFAPPRPARPDRGDQLLDPALQPAGHQLPRPADPLLRARPRADRGLPGRLPRPRHALAIAIFSYNGHDRSSACSPTATSRPRAIAGYIDESSRSCSTSPAPCSRSSAARLPARR